MNRTISMLSIALVALSMSACSHQDAASVAAANADPAGVSATVSPHAPSPAAPTQAAILDACSLVTAADAESILGEPAKLSEREKDDKYASHCSYEAVNQAGGVNLLGVEIHTDEDASDARNGLAMNSKMYSSNASGNIYLYEPLTGIGDDAFMVSNKPPAGMPAEMLGMLSDQQMVFAIKGAKDIHIITSYSGKPRKADTLKALAKKLADHI